MLGSEEEEKEMEKEAGGGGKQREEGEDTEVISHADSALGFDETKVA